VRVPELWRRAKADRALIAGTSMPASNAFWYASSQSSSSTSTGAIPPSSEEVALKRALLKNVKTNHAHTSPVRRHER